MRTRVAHVRRLARIGSLWQPLVPFAFVAMYNTTILSHTLIKKGCFDMLVLLQPAN